MTAPQIYEGSIRHRRFHPKLNAFCYRLSMWYLDLDALPTKKEMPWWCPFRFRRDDYLDQTERPLKQVVKERIKKQFPEKTIEKVFLLTQVRCFGYVINPLSIYYCFDQQGLQSVIAEVTNTPWAEKKIYVLASDPKKAWQRINFDKKMHVSPFNPMQMQYQWVNDLPSDALTVHLSCWVEEVKHLDATLRLEKSSAARMTPWMTWKIVALIYAQAAKLYILKRIPFYSNQRKKSK